MPLRRLKPGYFILEGMNSFATVYYFYYLYFFMEQRFGFGNQANLALAALNGAIYMVFSWWGGRFAQRCGYFTALKLGFVIMIVSLATGAQVNTAWGQVLVMAGTVCGMCFTWPTLEALISEGETATGLPHMVGIYNIVWAGTAAASYFMGGAALEHLGTSSLFYVPVGIQFCQLALTLWLEKEVRRRTETATPPGPAPDLVEEIEHFTGRKTKVFLRLAWLANPFAYIAVNTLIAVMPGVAHRLGLSTMLAGFCCSAWCFARVGAFVLLWRWQGWHYRFRWLLTAYVVLVCGFALVVMASNLVVLVVAEIALGGVLGLIYYSSLFYSMDLGDTKGEHGGFHEAAIGLGNFAGPAVGAASLHFLPQYPNSGVLAVSGLLMGGLAGLLLIWRKGRVDDPAPGPKNGRNGSAIKH